MIGVSLSASLLSGNPEGASDSALLRHYGDTDALLDAFKKLGVGSIEIRSVSSQDSPETVRKIAETVWRHGMTLTVHGRLQTGEGAVAEVLAPLSQVLDALAQDTLTVTLHPIASGTVEALTALSDYAAAHDYRVVFALENVPASADGGEEDPCLSLLETVKAVKCKNVGICWDFCNYLCAVDKHKNGDRTVLPPQAFINHTVHTHISGCREQAAGYSLSAASFPIDDYCNALGYRGVYNIELDPEVLAADTDICQAYTESIAELRRVIPLRSVSVEAFYDNYESYWDKAFSILDNPSGDMFSLEKATGYIFNTSGVKWAMDLNVRYKWFRCDREKILSNCAKLDFIVVTHEHKDHLDLELVKLLSDTNVKWVIPEYFNMEALRASGLREENTVVVKAGGVYTFGSLTLRPFDSLHYRPGNGNGVREYGYHVTLGSKKTLLFPADVRNYDASLLPDFGGVDYLFAHVWLGDSTAVSLQCEPNLSLFAEFVVALAPKKLILSHLFENGRAPADMWSYVHAGMAADAVYRRCPSIFPIFTKVGEVFELS